MKNESKHTQKKSKAARDCAKIEKQWAIEALKENIHFQRCQKLCMIIWKAAGRPLTSEENADVCELASILSVSARVAEARIEKLESQEE